MEIKTLTADPANFGGSRPAQQIKYLCVHYTAVSGDTAHSEAIAFATHIVKASAHYFVDDNEVWQSVPDLRVAWAVGDALWTDTPSTGGGKMHGKVTNSNSISVELCGTLGGGSLRASEKTLDRAAKLCAELMKKYGIPLPNVYRHFDVSGKHCPAYMMDESEWEKFKSRIEAEYMDAQTFGRLFEQYRLALRDNDASAYSEKAREWAVDSGLINGALPRPDGTPNYMWEDFMTREELVTVLYRLVSPDGGRD